AGCAGRSAMSQTQDPREQAKPNGHGRTEAPAQLPFAFPRPPSEPDDPRVIQALDTYLTALEAGRPLDRRAFLAEHAEIAAPLEKCLDGLEFVQKLAPELSQSSAAPAHDPAAPAAEIASATPLGDFRIVREVGRGGMGVVYGAEQLSLS